MELDPNFFSQSTIEVAPQLLGKVLTYDHPDGRITGVINEVEAYTEDDPSCHAFNGRKTHRNAPMFGAPGTVYIYMIYGMYYCLNIVTESKGRGCAVLIRSVIGLEGRTLLAKHRHCREDRLDTYLNGPGKLMKGFQIPVDLNYSSLFDRETPLSVADYGIIPLQIFESTRIGISKGIDLKWRFYAHEFKGLD